MEQGQWDQLLLFHVDNKHDVTLIGSPLENDQIENLNKDSFHKHLNCKLSDKIVFLNSKSLNEEIKKNTMSLF